MRKKCSYCGGSASQCRCPREVLETEQLMARSQRNGRLLVVQPEQLSESESEMIAFEERLKAAFAKRSE